MKNISERDEVFMRDLYEFCLEHKMYPMDSEYAPDSYWFSIGKESGIDLIMHEDDFSIAYKVHLDQQGMLDLINDTFPDEVEIHKEMSLSQHNRKSRYIPHVQSHYVLAEDGFHGSLGFLLYGEDGGLYTHTMKLTIDEFDSLERIS